MMSTSSSPFVYREVRTFLGKHSELLIAPPIHFEPCETYDVLYIIAYSSDLGLTNPHINIQLCEGVVNNRPKWLVTSRLERRTAVNRSPASENFPRPLVFGFMNNSTKRKAPSLGEVDADRGTPYNTDAQPAKKGKRERAPSGGDRPDLPAVTRKPDLMSHFSTCGLDDRVPPSRGWRFAMAWTDEPGKRSHFVRPPDAVQGPPFGNHL